MEMKGDYAFLSNFYPCKIVDREYPGIIYNSVEAAFQAAKVKEEKVRREFSFLEPNFAKKKGRKIKLRPDWEQVKDSIMEYYCRQKFSNPELRTKLMNVTEPIVEDNWWHDTYWGKCNGIGENKLGQILTKIREEALEHRVIQDDNTSKQDNSTPKCPFCGGEFHLLLCDEEGNPHDDDYLSNPYSGISYCIVHSIKDVPNDVHCPIATSYEDEAISEYLYETKEEALAALRIRSN